MERGGRERQQDELLGSVQYFMVGVGHSGESMAQQAVAVAVAGVANAISRY